MPDNLTPEQRRRCMSSVRSRDTSAEVRLRSELHRLGLRFRKNARGVPGSPDVAFTRVRLAVFVDGEFWHGRHFEQWRETQSPFWQSKIARNIERDAQVDEALKALGWDVLRFWERAVRKDARPAAGAVRDRYVLLRSKLV